MRWVAGMREALTPRPKLTVAEMDELALRAKTDLAAREELTLHMMGLIADAARRHRNQLGEDAFGEASLALLEALETFHAPMTGFRRWAVVAIRLRMLRVARDEMRYRARSMPVGAAQGSPIHLPELLARAYAEGAVTRRQAEVLHAHANGESVDATADHFMISRTTYYNELRAAREGLQSYVR